MSAEQTSGLGFVGQSVKRVEDDRLLRGEGTFVADVNPDGVVADRGILLERPSVLYSLADNV